MEPLKLPSKELREKGLHEAFVIGIALKGAGALFEATLGALLLWSGSFIDVVLELINNEYLDDPNGFFASHFHALLAPTHEAQVFGGLYLLVHGVVKIAIVVGLLRDKMWAYPAALSVFALLVSYQLVRFSSTYSTWLLVLTLLDVFMMWLIYHEYRAKLRARDSI